MMKVLLANWKTTAMGMCVCLLGLKSAIKFDATGHVAMTQEQWFGVGVSLVAAGLGLLMKDSGTALQAVPGGDVQVGPSHETPDNPNAKAITPK